MEKLVFQEAVEAFAKHAVNMQNPGYLDIASLLTRYVAEPEPKIEAKIVAHPKGDYAAEWIQTHVYEPERHSLASAYWLAATILQDAKEWGTRSDIAEARRKLDEVTAEQRSRGYR